MTDADPPRPSVRAAEPADGPRLRAIQSAALTDPAPGLLAAGLEGPALALVVETDRPVGYALAVTGGDVASLAELAVAPDEQGRGHGSTLLSALFARLREQDTERVRLTARADDERALSFYRSFGFEAVDRLPGYFEAADGVVLARTL